MTIIGYILIYFFAMVSISVAVGAGVLSAFRIFFKNKKD